MLLDFFANIAIITAFLFIMGQVFRKYSLDTKVTVYNKTMAGIFFGILGIVLMTYTIYITNIVILDLRNVVIVMAGIYGGPITIMVATMIIALFRLLNYGVSQTSIIASFAVVVMGMGCAVLAMSKKSKNKKYIFMFLYTTIVMSITVAYLVGDYEKLSRVFLIYWGVSFLGGLFSYFTYEYITSSNTTYREMEYYRVMADNFSDMISTHRLDGTYVYVSPYSQQLLGYTPEELKEVNIYDLICKEDAEKAQESFLKIINNQSAITQVYKIRKKDGNYIWVETNFKGIKEKEEKPKEIICVTRDITQRKKIEEELVQSKEKTLEILESIQDAFFSLDPNWNFTYVNKQSQKMMEKNEKDLIGKSAWDIFPKKDLYGFYEKLSEAITKKSISYFEEYHSIGKRWFSVSVYPSKHGTSVYYRDITQHKSIEEELKKSDARFKSLVNSMEDIIFTLDSNQKISGVYGNWFKKMELQEKHFIGKRIVDILATKEDSLHEEAVLKALKGENIVYNWSTNEEVSKKYYQTSLSPFRNSEEQIIGVVGVGRDITKQKIIENQLKDANEKLKKLSFTDGLTQVANRRYFNERIMKEWKRAARNEKEISILLVDIDYFKMFNDEYGHLEGDVCLKAIVDTMKKTFKRPGDLVARYGGEEFIIILPETDEKGALKVANEFRINVESLKIPNKFSKTSPFVTVSIGVATVIPETSSGYEDFIKKADKALYKAKEQGRNQVKVY